MLNVSNFEFQDLTIAVLTKIGSARSESSELPESSLLPIFGTGIKSKGGTQRSGVHGCGGVAPRGTFPRLCTALQNKNIDSRTATRET